MLVYQRVNIIKPQLIQDILKFDETYPDFPRSHPEKLSASLAGPRAVTDMTWTDLLGLFFSACGWCTY